MSFQLDSIDKKFLMLLSKEPRHAAYISKRFSIHHATATYRLKRLAKYGFIHRHGRGQKNAHLWKLSIKRSPRSLFYVNEGPTFYEMYNEEKKVAPRSVTYSVQGTRAAQAIIKDIPLAQLRALHKTQRRKKSIVRGIVNKDSIKVSGEMSVEMLKSHVGRSLGANMYKFPNRFSGDGEIIMLPKALILINQKRKRNLVVKDQAMVKILYEVFETLFELLDKHQGFRIIDVDALLMQELEKKIGKNKRKRTQVKSDILI